MIQHPRKHGPEHLLGHALAGLAQGALIGRALGEGVAQETPQRQRVRDPIFQFGVIEDVFEEADEHAFEEHHRIEGGPAHLERVERLGERIDEVEIQYLSQPLVELAPREGAVQIGGVHEHTRFGCLFASLAHRLPSGFRTLRREVRHRCPKLILASRLFRLYPEAASWDLMTPMIRRLSSIAVLPELGAI